MAGTNKLLKKDQVLFRAGDASDGMYLIRRGECRVYLEQNGTEVALATVGEGGMIGEMALFDQQPRSASVKAISAEVEVTLISLDEFGKLMKQIPKWFVALMSTLSSRLRQTNERLKNLESNLGGAAAAPAAAASGPPAAAQPAAPYQGVLRHLHLMILIWHRDGEKEGKDSILRRAAVDDALVLFGEDKAKFTELLKVLVEHKLLSIRVDSYKNQVMAAANRASLGNLAIFVANFVKANPKQPFLKPGQIDLLKTLEKVLLASPYESLSTPLSDLAKEGKRNGLDTATWEKDILGLQHVGEEVKVVKTSAGVGLKSGKKEVSGLVRHCEILAGLYKAKLI